MEFEDITSVIIGTAMRVHSALGPGLLEETYKQCLKYLLIKNGLKVETEVSVPIIFEGLTIGAGYRIDILIEDKIIVELKSVQSINPLHKAQLLTYLKLSQKRVGLLLNFNVPSLREGVTRLINPRFSSPLAAVR